ncbi:beta-glucuronidase [Labilibaculum manganireducens]|uniref:Beta-glucuronidase n=1 Tax=Labilibaculum manganireducens TaxID=1940525 RepID=A0A2N3IH31_9BACT|nr:glycoside hydrolase family 2 TIM barrel-domain containing protein [Labilibaculum manganireducens]PKQ69568.1 beta-glucuronidase [Labilibaculum manganireducens]
MRITKFISVLVICLLFGAGNLFAQGNFITNVNGRTHQSLNGKWKYILDQYETGQIGFSPLYKNSKAKSKSDRVEYSFDNAQTLWVPGSWNSQKEELYYYEGSVWFRKTFDYQPKHKNSRIFIYVGAANYKTTFSFNGKKLGVHEGGFTPFSFEVTDLLKKQDNFLILGVSNRREKDYIPAMVTDWYNHGGITRDVKIVEVPQTYIDDYTLVLQKESLNRKTRVVKGSVQLAGNDYPDKAKVEIKELGVVAEVSINKEGRGEFAFSSKKMSLWSPENPKLYDVKLIAGDDELTDRIGFRTVETEGKEILLNGKPVFLRGVSIHDENPVRRDRAHSMDDAKLLLGWAKEMGCNFARLAHYPHQENIVRLADEMGILLWEELPLYWGIDWKNEEVLKKAKVQYSELVRRDKNRAATIIWSIANETVPGEARNHFLREVASQVRSLDSTRLLSAACKKDGWEDGLAGDNYKVSDPIAEVFDIVSFNEYQGWYGGSPETCRNKRFTIEYNKPVIISEFGGGAIEGFHADKETRWSEEYQEYMYQENLAMFDKIEGVVGLTPWILVDFMTPLRQLPNVQDGWNRKGLVSESGAKKKAFYIMQNYYKKKKEEYK